MALSYLLWAVSYNFLLFLLARVLCGICKGNVSISTSVVTDVTSHEGRSKGMVRGGKGEGREGGGEGRGGKGEGREGEGRGREGRGKGEGREGGGEGRERGGKGEGLGSVQHMATAAGEDLFCPHPVSLSSTSPTSAPTPSLHLPPQALVGVSFSLGFIFGPTIGALFSILGHSSYMDSLHAFQLPALFAFLMATADIVIIAALFRETLPAEQRVHPHTSTHTLHMMM